ncbi:hypothetical protein OPIT5_23035 [Opitutaceae bacterium TAV5]|nr:hypothetical protein OPIT5_23035 [Opitutaceae bacterium TAV5]
MGGVYCEDVEVAPLMSDTAADFSLAASTRGMAGVKPYAVDPEAAARLWTLSEQLTGLQAL